MGLSPDKLQKQLNRLKFRMKHNTQNWIKTYPNYKRNIDTVIFNRAQNGMFTTYQDILILQANLKGNVNTNNVFLSDKDSKIKNIKNEYDSMNVKLKSNIARNLASGPFKLNKYDDTYESMLHLSYYFIGSMTLSFFIYKQLKES